MKVLFGASAARLGAMAGVTLGWQPDQFWAATPAELAGVLTALIPANEQGLAPENLQKLMEQFPDG